MSTTTIPDPAAAELTPIGRLAEHRLLSHHEVIRLAKRIEQGDARARDELVRCNMRLVVRLASQFAKASGQDIDDLVQMGAIGLMRAVDKYDWRKGFRFSTYATHWIKQALQRGLDDTTGTVRIPTHIRLQMRHLRRMRARAERCGDPAPSDDEVAQVLGVDTGQVAWLRELCDRRTVSLDSPVRDDSDATMADFIPDTAAAGAEQAEQQITREVITGLLHHLAQRERRILELRFGLDGARARNLTEVAQEMSLSPIQVRRLERLAVSHLKDIAASADMAVIMEHAA